MNRAYRLDSPPADYVVGYVVQPTVVGRSRSGPRLAVLKGTGKSPFAALSGAIAFAFHSARSMGSRLIAANPLGLAKSSGEESAPESGSSSDGWSGVRPPAALPCFLRKYTGPFCIALCVFCVVYFSLRLIVGAL